MFYQSHFHLELIIQFKLTQIFKAAVEFTFKEVETAQND